MSETEKGPVPEGDAKPEANVFEKVVLERKAKLDRMNRRFQEQAAKRACVAAKAGDGFGSLASVVREAAANGLDGDEIAGALGVRRLTFRIAVYLPSFSSTTAIFLFCRVLFR